MFSLNILFLVSLLELLALELLWLELLLLLFLFLLSIQELLVEILDQVQDRVGLEGLGGLGLSQDVTEELECSNSNHGSTEDVGSVFIGDGLLGLVLPVHDGDAVARHGAVVVVNKGGGSSIVIGKNSEEGSLSLGDLQLLCGDNPLHVLLAVRR